MNRKVAKGLGIGCAALALVFVALAGGGIWLGRNMTREFEPVRTTEEELVAAHGTPADWSPAAGLVPAADRVEAFVRVRRETAQWRSHLARSTVHWRAIQETPNPLLRTVRGLRAAGDAGTAFAGFWTARNEALLAAGMGPGEYAWLYHLVYHAWLGHDPAAGAGAADIQLGGGVGVGVSEDQATARGDVERARELARSRMRDLVLPMLEHAPAGGEEAVAWRQEELARLAADPERWPWQTDLPAAIAAAFAPHETEMAAAWNAAANPLELLFEASSGPEPDGGE